jgi:hypothetical protein
MREGVPCDVLCDVGVTWDVLLYEYAYGDCVKMNAKLGSGRWGYFMRQMAHRCWELRSKL